MAELSDAIAAQPERAVALRLADEAWDDGPAARRAARGRRIARDLVELSRLQGGGERVVDAPIDLARLLREICVHYPKVEIAGVDPFPLHTDSRRLARVLTLLLDNACLHGAPPVAVRYDACEIVVADSGPGLEPKVLARATEPFVAGRSARGRGVGLGLAIAARQAALLGAELQLCNAVDGGALARLRFDPTASARAWAPPRLTA
ncbi:MAG: ATP-binding protein [Solirubrobacteraceae bacterium]|jgi:signal transduction histidine kinase